MPRPIHLRRSAIYGVGVSLARQHCPGHDLRYGRVPRCADRPQGPLNGSCYIFVTMLNDVVTFSTEIRGAHVIDNEHFPLVTLKITDCIAR